MRAGGRNEAGGSGVTSAGGWFSGCACSADVASAGRGWGWRGHRCFSCSLQVLLLLDTRVAASAGGVRYGNFAGSMCSVEA